MGGPGINEECYLVVPASSHMLVSKIKPCMCKYELIQTVKLRISSGLSGLTRSGRCYTSEELEKRRKEIGKGTVEPVRNIVTTEEAKEFLKVIRNLEYSVIQQLNKSPAQISILALLISSKVHRNALLKVLKETRVPTSATESAFEGIELALCSSQIISRSLRWTPLIICSLGGLGCMP